MNIVIRVDSSEKIGSGHLMRCLTLADLLRNDGASIYFISRKLPGNVCFLPENKGYVIHKVPYSNEKITGDLMHADWLGTLWQRDAQDTLEIIRSLDNPVDWLIVDHYALDRRWEGYLRPYVKKIMVIDDLADRFHDCDLLLDQNLNEDMGNRYDGLVSGNCRRFLGPRYALLRPEFFEVRKALRMRDGNVRRILIFFGGVDPTDETTKALQALRRLDMSDVIVDVIVGVSNSNRQQVGKFCSNYANMTFHCNINNIASLMASADLAIGAGGTSAWERCFLGLPTITIVIALNQMDTTVALAKAGAILNLGWHYDVTKKHLANAVKLLLEAPANLREMGAKALNVMGSRGFEVKPDLVQALMGDGNARS